MISIKRYVTDTHECLCRCVDPPVEVRRSRVLIGQLEPGVGHDLVDVGPLGWVGLQKLLQQAYGS